MFDFIVRLLGSGIAGLIMFINPVLSFNSQELTIKTILEHPITEEIKSVLKQDCTFRVEYYCSVIVDDNKVYKDTIYRSVTYRDGYYIDGKYTPEEFLDTFFGDLYFTFYNVVLKENSEILLFIKAKIQPDRLFEESTGLNTGILWENYVPRYNETYIYGDELFILVK